MVFLGLFILDLWANTCQTHYVTRRPCHLTLEVMVLVGDTSLHAPSVLPNVNFKGFPVRKI